MKNTHEYATNRSVMLEKYARSTCHGKASPWQMEQEQGRLCAVAQRIAQRRAEAAIGFGFWLVLV